VDFLGGKGFLGEVMRSVFCVGILLSLWMLLVVQAHAQQCIHWYHEPDQSFNNGLDDRANFRIFDGTIGKKNVRLKLHYDPSTNALVGIYGYEREPGTLALSGTMLHGGSDINLTEMDQSGRVTGHLVLAFVYPKDRPPPASVYDCFAVSGHWYDPSRKVTLPVDLLSVGELLPSDVPTQELNDLAAFKVQKAILEHNPAAFASQLRYPFCTSNYLHGKRVSKIWNDKGEVIAHYNQIVNDNILPSMTVLHAVPHFLEIMGNTSNWMGYSMPIKSGKVMALCNESCQPSLDWCETEFLKASEQH
jgi:hypothetical protein